MMKQLLFFTTNVKLLLIVSIYVLNHQKQHNDIASDSFDSTYDYIIIGGGSAGSVVASRLSQNCNVKVLLLEAGGQQTIITDMPGKFDETYTSGDYSWHDLIQPQKYSCFAFENNQMIWESGRVIGGGSTHNAMNYNRGNWRDYDNWNSSGWRFNDVLPYFLKSENNSDKKIVMKNPKYHNTNGLLSVSTQKEIEPYVKYFIKTANKAGYPTIDLNGPTQTGIATVQDTIRNGFRESTASAFLENNHAYKRNNLHIILNATATKILFDKHNNNKNHGVDGKKHLPKASQVEFYFKNQYHKVKATKEIIISAGTIRTPQILMLSGIGDKSQLQKLNIDVISDVPGVGNNLHDQLRLDLISFVGHPNSHDNQVLYTPSTDLSLENLYNFFVNHSGPLSYLTNIFMYISTPFNHNHDWPDSKLSFTSATLPENLTEFTQRFRLKHKNRWVEYLSQYKGKNYVMSSPYLKRPLSRGTINLKSKNPFDQPLINPNYLKDQRDVDTLVYAIKKLSQIFNTKSMGIKFKILYLEKPIPDCEQHICSNTKLVDCDRYLICLVRSFPRNEWHYVGTSRIKSKNDDENDDWVVDQQLRVKGVQGLRVIDSSIMPLVPNGNTNAPAIMIGEKGADLIKNNYQF